MHSDIKNYVIYKLQIYTSFLIEIIWICSNVKNKKSNEKTFEHPPEGRPGMWIELERFVVVPAVAPATPFLLGPGTATSGANPTGTVGLFFTNCFPLLSYLLKFLIKI